MKWLAALVICIGLTGCSPRMDTPEIEARTLELYNQESARNNLKTRGRSVKLAHENGNSYKGYVDLTDGKRVGMTVTYDGETIYFKEDF